MKRLGIHQVLTFLLLLIPSLNTSLAVEPVISPVKSMNTDPNSALKELVLCKNPRPEICYEVYSPVCAIRDTKKHCLAEPCLPQQTFSNDCKACAEADVIGFLPSGKCR